MSSRPRKPVRNRKKAWPKWRQWYCQKILQLNRPITTTTIRYSCNKITATQIQISRQNWNGFFSNISHQMMIKLTPIVSRAKSKWYKSKKKNHNYWVFKLVIRLERHIMSTWTLFVKIWTVSNCKFNAIFFLFFGLYHLLFVSRNYWS